jgi:hypothetical protein
MDKYIGLDVHATSCTAAVINAQGNDSAPTSSRRTGQR